MRRRRRRRSNTKTMVTMIITFFDHEYAGNDDMPPYACNCFLSIVKAEILGNFAGRHAQR